MDLLRLGGAVLLAGLALACAYLAFNYDERKHGQFFLPPGDSTLGCVLGLLVSLFAPRWFWRGSFLVVALLVGFLAVALGLHWL